MPPPLIQLKEIALTFGGTPLLTSAELSVSAGERVCLVGRNGSGKSTLLKIASGVVEPDRGTRFVQPGATVRYLAQEADFAGAMTTREYVMQGLGPTDEAYQANYLIEQLGLTGDEDTATLSGGEARRAAIARALAPDPDILLLDEPTNHLDLTTIEWLEQELSSRRAALVLISHDRRFLSALSRTTVWLDRGETRRLDRGFGEFEGWRDEVLAEEERDQHKLDRKIVAEEHWLRYGVSGRRKRNVKRLAGLHQLREDRRTYRGSAGNVQLGASDGANSGKLVIDADRVNKSYGARAIVSDFSTRIQRGDRIGIVGPNGAGKTTLINLLIGTQQPDSGTIRLGANLSLATLDQRRERLNPNATVQETLSGSSDTVTVGGATKHVVGYMRDFLFSQEQARTPVHALSGGERGRLMLAQALAQPSNLLVLDEPTNDLDIETLDVLEEMLSDYAGTVLLISHDRDFLDRIVNGVIVPEGDGKWLEYAGGYSDMLAQRGEDLRRAPTARQKVEAAQKASGASARKSKQKLSFKDKHALEALPKQMDALRAQIAKLQRELDDPKLYARDRKRFDETSAAIGAAHAKLGAAEEKWLELEMLREEIEG